MQTPAIVRKFQEHRHWFDTTREILTVLKDAKLSRNPTSSALAAIAVFGLIADHLFPAESEWQLLRRRGYVRTDYHIGGFLCELLMHSALPVTTVVVDLSSQLRLWETEKIGIAAIYRGGEYSDGPFLRDGDEAAFIEFLQEVIWKNGSDLMLSANQGYFWRGAKKFFLTSMDPPGPYIGKKQPQDYASRIGKYGTVPRTILLRGPTGIGKSVLARHVALLVGRGSTRTLKIAASTLKSCRFKEVIDLAKFFRPSVLLLDDLNLSDKSNTEEFLTLLEVLRNPDCLVIITMMASTDFSKTLEMGDWHFEGMRPGRIDEIFTFYLPDEEDREAILKYYFGLFKMPLPKKALLKKIVKATENLPGAYLMEVARRLHIHGTLEWKMEVENVCYTAPRPGNEEEDVTTKSSDSSLCDEKSTSQ